MKKVTDIYSDKVVFSDIACSVRSESARRAINLFPTDKDLQEILTLETVDQHRSNEINIDSYLFDRPNAMTGLLTSSEIISMSE